MELLYRVLWWVYASVFLVLFLSATVHHHLGLRRHYIQFLLRLFAFGQERVERKRLPRGGTRKSEDGETPTGEERTDQPSSPLSPGHPQAPGIGAKGFHLGDVLEYISAGMAAVTEDSLTKSFEPEELPTWNLLSRTNDRAYEFVSFRLTVCWVLGFLIRYLVLLPLRLVILVLGIVLFWGCMLLVGLFPSGPLKRWLNQKLSVFCFDFVASSLSLVATFHNTENIPKNGIAVANHTSPIDSVVLATHNCYDMVGQQHSGFLSIFMRGLSLASTHIWFERSDAKDRSLVIKRLRDHANNPDLPPILIYPEGVCVNNTSVMQFKKGAFEIDTVIYPIAIRFDARFGDAFWWQDKFLHYILCMMTSWAIVCNVWYLPPMRRRPGESASAFAARVKAKIAHQGGMIDLTWDGFLKVQPVKDEWRKKQQEEFARHLQETTEEEKEDREMSSVQAGQEGSEGNEGPPAGEVTRAGTDTGEDPGDDSGAGSLTDDPSTEVVKEPAKVYTDTGVVMLSEGPQSAVRKRTAAVSQDQELCGEPREPLSGELRESLLSGEPKESLLSGEPRDSLLSAELRESLVPAELRESLLPAELTHKEE